MLCRHFSKYDDRRNLYLTVCDFWNLINVAATSEKLFPALMICFFHQCVFGVFWSEPEVWRRAYLIIQIDTTEFWSFSNKKPCFSIDLLNKHRFTNPAIFMKNHPYFPNVICLRFQGVQKCNIGRIWDNVPWSDITRTILLTG